MVKNLETLKTVLLTLSISYNFYCTHINRLEKSSLQNQILDLQKQVDSLSEQLKLLADQNTTVETIQEPSKGVFSWLSNYYDPALLDFVILVGGIICLVILYNELSKSGGNGSGSGNCLGDSDLHDKGNCLANSFNNGPGLALSPHGNLHIVEKRSDFLRMVFSYTPENSHFKHVKYTDTEAATTFMAELFLKESFSEVVSKIRENYPDFDPGAIRTGPINWVFPYKLPENLDPSANPVVPGGTIISSVADLLS